MVIRSVPDFPFTKDLKSGGQTQVLMPSSLEIGHVPHMDETQKREYLAQSMRGRRGVYNPLP